LTGKTLPVAVLFCALVASGQAHATGSTFAVFTPPGTAANISLVGLPLTANDVVRFRFTDPGLASLGVVSAQWTFQAAETSAAALGAYEVATFDGTFSRAYLGPVVVTSGGHVLTVGDNLLSGTFGHAIFSGSGSADSLNASSMGAKNVLMASSLLNFDPNAEECISLSFTSIIPPTTVGPPGALADFTAVWSGNFAASVSAVPGAAQLGAGQPGLCGAGCDAADATT
jgi:hypothetical protein